MRESECQNNIVSSLATLVVSRPPLRNRDGRDRDAFGVWFVAVCFRFNSILIVVLLGQNRVSLRYGSSDTLARAT